MRAIPSPLPALLAGLCLVACEPATEPATPMQPPASARPPSPFGAGYGQPLAPWGAWPAPTTPAAVTPPIATGPASPTAGAAPAATATAREAAMPPAPAPSTIAADGAAAPPPPSPPRRIEGALDSAPASAAARAGDVRDPWARPGDGKGPRPRELRDPWAHDGGAAPAEAAAPAAAPGALDAPPLPTAELVVVLSIEPRGNAKQRLNDARRALAGLGAVKRADSTWELPSASSDHTPQRVRDALVKGLCDEDHATLYFVDGGALRKLEAPGASACEK